MTRTTQSCQIQSTGEATRAGNELMIHHKFFLQSWVVPIMMLPGKQQQAVWIAGLPYPWDSAHHRAMLHTVPHEKSQALLSTSVMSNQT